MTDPILPTTTPKRGYARCPALNDEACPKCGAVNPNDTQVYVWRVADERGAHLQCDVCAHEWRFACEQIQMTDQQRQRIADAIQAGKASRE